MGIGRLTWQWTTGRGDAGGWNQEDSSATRRAVLCSTLLPSLHICSQVLLKKKKRITLLHWDNNQTDIRWIRLPAGMSGLDHWMPSCLHRLKVPLLVLKLMMLSRKINSKLRLHIYFTVTKWCQNRGISSLSTSNFSHVAFTSQSMMCSQRMESDAIRGTLIWAWVPSPSIATLVQVEANQ